jgi:hypothetical protein
MTRLIFLLLVPFLITLAIVLYAWEIEGGER